MLAEVGWGVSAWWPIHRGAQKLFVMILAAAACSNAPSCCYARANYLRLTISAAENLISAGFQCQDTYSYGILVPNCLTPDYEIYYPSEAWDGGSARVTREHTTVRVLVMLRNVRGA